MFLKTKGLKNFQNRKVASMTTPKTILRIHCRGRKMNLMLKTKMRLPLTQNYVAKWKRNMTKLGEGMNEVGNTVQH